MKMFKLTKEIRSKEGVLHFKRWSIFSCKWFNIYFHAIHKHDEDQHLHSHPWNFFVICLSGFYLERLVDREKFVGPLTMRYRDHRDYHKIEKLYSNTIYTLVLTGKKQPEEWGYLVNGQKIDHVTYRQLKRENKLV
jgi:hypothetical protein